MSAFMDEHTGPPRFEPRPSTPTEGRLILADEVWAEVRAELDRAWRKFPATQMDLHHAWAVLKEEEEELWDEIKADRPIQARGEAVQVAAMAVRLIVDLYKVRQQP
jgi:hypothetical protein